MVRDPSNNPTYCFRERTWASGNAYIGCVADTAKVDGFHMNPNAGAGFARLIAPKIFNSQWTGYDNVMAGIRVMREAAVTNIISPQTEGGDGTHRITADITGVLSQTTIIGSFGRDVVTTTPNQIIGLEPIIPADFSDAFLGANGSALNATRWTTLLGTGTGRAIDINTNRMRLTTGATGGYSSNDRVSATTTLSNTLTDVDLLFQYEHSGAAVENYLYAGVRSTGADVRAGSSYSIEIGPNSAQLNRNTAGTPTSLQYLGNLGFVLGTRSWFRLRVRGTTVSWKYWREGTAEPPWSWSGTDANITAGGLVSFTLSGGSAATNTSAYMRRVIVTAL
jgi:hypothetical protein